MRYAIYFTPAPDTALWRFGSSVLGYDARARTTVAFPRHGLWLEPWFLRIQETPARYGFHATLKAPFELAEGVSERALMDRAAVFGERNAPLCLPALEVALLDDFIALRPLSEDAEPNRLAAGCVREFDDMRAPLSVKDRARRLSQVLTPRQHAHLDRWGYPYVFEEFRFHMTLTGRVGAIEAPRMHAALEQVFSPLLGAPVVIDGLALFVEPEAGGPFTVLSRHVLSPERERKSA